MKKIVLFIAATLVSSCSFIQKSDKQIELIPYHQKDKYGYFDLEGKIVINPQFGYASVFREDIALVKTIGDEPKWGYIDKEGKYLINAIYKRGTIFQEGIAWVTTENSAPIAINKKGETIFTLKQAENVIIFSEGLAAFSISDSSDVKWGFVDKKGIVKINPQFKSVRSFLNGKCAVENKEGKWGYIDGNGKLIINYQFDGAQNFMNGKAVVYLDEKGGIIDEEGKYVINPQFDSILNDGKIFYVEQDDKIGWVDEKGKFIINPQFEEGNLFENSDLASIKSGDQYGYIDTKGKILINPQFEMALPFVNGNAIVKSGDKIGVVDSEGKFVVNPQFEELSFDVYYYLSSNNNYGTSNYSIKTDYFDIDKVIKIINPENPENLSFDDTFIAIAKKMSLDVSDFKNDSQSILIKDKNISNNANYSFGVLGEAKEYDYYSYNYTLSNNKPYGFYYAIELKNNGYGKTKNLKKSLEKKFSSYTILKKGSIDGEEVTVLNNKKQTLIIACSGENNLAFYILNKDFEINNYLRKIDSDDDSSEIYAEPVVEEAAPVVEEAVEEYYD